MDKEKLIEYIIEMLKDANPDTVECVYYFLIHRD